MTMMSLWLSRLDTGREALDQMRDVLARAKAAGGAYTPSTQEQKDLLAVLTPLAGAVNGKLIFSHLVNGAELALFLKEQHLDDWTECRDAVTVTEVKIRSGSGQLGGAEISTLRRVAEALNMQCASLLARTGGC